MKNKILFQKVVEYLEGHPESTTPEIIKEIPEFQNYKQPRKSFWKMMDKYNDGEVVFTDKSHRKFKLKDTEPITVRIPNQFISGDITELIEIDCNGWNLK